MSAPAQVLARPGWAGSGVAPETWWRSAIFYRVDPARFQDSNSDGVGDLAGIAQRLDYIQALGVDGLVLDGSPGGQLDPGAIGELVRSASEHQLRVVMTVTPAMQAGDQQALLRTVHEWLITGAAGLWVPKPARTNQADAAYAALLGQLRTMLRQMPGDRVLLTDPAPGASAPELRGTIRGGLFGGADGQLTAAAELPVDSGNAAALRGSLASLAAGAESPVPLLRFAQDPRTDSPEAVADAALLLASRAAAIFDFGDEIGLDAYTPEAGSGGALPVMQWTPANVQQAAAAPIERHAAPKPDPNVYGTYVPYVRPPSPRLTGGSPGLPAVTVDTDIPVPLPAPDTLPGYTTGTLPVEPVDGEHIDVATEDRDPHSVLDAYRQLIALHHGDATLRNGAQAVLNRDAQDALVWVRRAPAGSRTAGDVVVAANLADHAITLSLDADLAHIGVRPGSLRPLFQWSPTLLTGEDTGALQLPAHAVFVGEIRR